MKNLFKQMGFCALFVGVAGFASCSPEADAVVKLPAPVDLKVVQVDGTNVKLLWKPVPEASGYTVRLNGKAYRGLTSSSQTISDLMPLANYNWTVCAVDDRGNEGLRANGKSFTTGNGGSKVGSYEDILGKYSVTGINAQTKQPVSWTEEIVSLPNQPNMYAVYGGLGWPLEDDHLYMAFELKNDKVSLLDLYPSTDPDSYPHPSYPSLMLAVVVEYLTNGIPDGYKQGGESIELMWNPVAKTLTYPETLDGRDYVVLWEIVNTGEDKPKPMLYTDGGYHYYNNIVMRKIED